MIKLIFTSLIMSTNIFCMGMAYADSTFFKLNVLPDVISQHRDIPSPQYLGNAVLQNGITLPAYQLSFMASYSDRDYETQAPKSLIINKAIKSKYQKDLAVYYFKDSWFLIPKNWILTQADVGASSMGLTAIPPNGQKGYFRYWTNNGGCVACGVATVSLFFKQADIINQQEFGGKPNYHNSKPTIQSVRIRPKTEAWRTSIDGQNIDGLAYFDEEDYFTWTATVSLPKSQATLATPILNWYLSPKE